MIKQEIKDSVLEFKNKFKIKKQAKYKYTIDKIKKWREKNPQKNRAHKIVFTELRAKRLFKFPCVVCGNTKSEAHHEDYSKPLDVIWLCKKHHVEADKKRREKEKSS